VRRATRATDGARAETLDFHAFFEAEYERLGRALYVLTGSFSDADELAQEAMVRVYERWERVRGMASPTGYLYRTAMNIHRNRLRRLQMMARSTLRPSKGPDLLEAVEHRDHVERLMMSLRLSLRQALVLVDLLGLDAEEAGAILNIEPVSVRVRLSRARAQLRREAGETDA
jgi:RNA polymerase sigma factor (sigma-70 family)